MRLALVVLLVACGGAQVRPRCDDAWIVVRARHQCADLRGGISGYWVFEVVTGPRRGAMVIAHYRDGAPNERDIGYGVSHWGVARASFDEASRTTAWGNSCEQLGPAPVYAGSIGDFEGHDQEAGARRAWAAKPCEVK